MGVVKYELKLINGSFVQYVIYIAESEREAIQMYEREYGGGQAWDLNEVNKMQDKE